MPAASPIPATDENLNAGASLYEDKCESCHGTADEPSAVAVALSHAPRSSGSSTSNGAVGVSDDPVGETYWKVKNGIRLSGMPAYGKALSETQLWQVSLLLSMGDKPLPQKPRKTIGR